jgi:hypothetical protein
MHNHLVLPEVSFIEAVCRRPRMYTATGTLEEVFCFLNGFYSGMITHTGDQRAIAQAERDWFAFLEFANPANPISPNRDWLTLYRSLHQAHVEDAAAFAQILGWVDDYRLMRQHARASDNPAATADEA